LGFEGYKRKDEQAFELKPKLTQSEETQLDKIAANLRSLMREEKSYRNPELSLSLLAEQLEVKPYLLSKCLKIVFQQKFNDYINGLRIEEVKVMLTDPAYSQYTLLSLAFDAGFNSKSSFNRAVVKLEGVTPSALKAKL
jgi:AraC-like DNA-binding protein